MTTEERNRVIEDVRQRYSNVIFPDVFLSPAWYGRSNPTIIEDRFAVVGLVKDEDGVEQEVPFAVGVSDQYNLIHHEEAIHHIEKVLAKDEAKEYGKAVIMPEMIGDGERMKVGIKFPDAVYLIQTEGKAKGRPVEPVALMWNSYDTSKLFGLAFGGTDQICTNGMIGHKVQLSVRKKHRLNLDVEMQASALLDGMAQFSMQASVWQSWARESIKAQDAEDLLEALPFGEKHKEEILMLPEVGTGETLESWMKDGKVNLYRLNGITTQFLSHEVESVMVRADKGPKIAKVFHDRETIWRNAGVARDKAA